MRNILFSIILFLVGCDSCVVVSGFIGQGEVKSVQYLQGGFFETTKTIVNFANGDVAVLEGGAFPIPKNVRIFEHRGGCPNLQGKEHYIIEEARGNP